MRLFDVDFFNIPTPAEETSKYPIEWALVREPNLWIPGKKPIGPVEIDWGHPLTEGLKAYFILTERQPIDLVTGNMGTLDNNAKYAPAVNGMGLKTANVSTDRVRFPYHPNYNIDNTDFTYLGQLYQITEPTSNVGIFAPNRTGSAGGEECFLYITGANEPRWFYHDGASSRTALFGSFVWPTGENVNVFYGLTYSSSDYYYFCIDGVMYDDTNNHTTAMANYGTTNDYSISNSGTDQTQSLNCVHYWHALWHRRLPDNVINEFYLDPYQFLIPA